MSWFRVGWHEAGLPLTGLQPSTCCTKPERSLVTGAVIQEFDAVEFAFTKPLKICIFLWRYARRFIPGSRLVNSFCTDFKAFTRLYSSIGLMYTSSSVYQWCSFFRVEAAKDDVGSFMSFTTNVSRIYATFQIAVNINTRKLCYRKDDRAMREPLRRYTTGCGDMAI